MNSKKKNQTKFNLLRTMFNIYIKKNIIKHFINRKPEDVTIVKTIETIEN